MARTQRVILDAPPDTHTVIGADHLPVDLVKECLQIKNRGAQESILRTAERHNQ